MAQRDTDLLFHRTWLGLAQPMEGLVFSLPVLSDAQCAPSDDPRLQQRLRDFVTFASEYEADEAAIYAAVANKGRSKIKATGAAAKRARKDERELARSLTPHFKNLRHFFEDFLGYKEGLLIDGSVVPSFYAPESGQEVRASFALKSREAFDTENGIAKQAPAPSRSARQNHNGRASSRSAAPGAYYALVWDLRDDLHEAESGERSIDSATLNLDKPETQTGPWHYPPTDKFVRLLKKHSIELGLLCNGEDLRLIYAPRGAAVSHLTFRLADMLKGEGRPILLALHTLLHSNRTYGKNDHVVYLLSESRNHQENVTSELAKQVADAIEILLHGFEVAARRDAILTHGQRLIPSGKAKARADYLQDALYPDESDGPGKTKGAKLTGLAFATPGGSHVQEGLLTLVLRLVFLLYAEDKSLFPIEDPLYAKHFSIYTLFDKLEEDHAAHPESMPNRFGAYSGLLSLFRAVYTGVKHGHFALPERHGRLFDPDAFRFLEGGTPSSTTAKKDADRESVHVPTIDDGTIHAVLSRLIQLGGQRLSYRDLSVEQIGAVYESLMGFEVAEVQSEAMRIRSGDASRWVETDLLHKLAPLDEKKLLKDLCGLSDIKRAALMKNLRDGTYEAQPSSRKKQKSNVDAANILSIDHASAGRLVLQPTASRRSTGSHYTPRSLTERLVKATLDPILACLGEAPKAEQILALKICDPAMGSGAFLVEVCRYLAAHVVASWQRSGEYARVLELHGDADSHAKRLVAEHCLYGVDINAPAVELAKVSLWLETLSRDKNFAYLDHALRHGDSLVGLSEAQVRAFHWAPIADGKSATVSDKKANAKSKPAAKKPKQLELFGIDDVLSLALHDAREARARIPSPIAVAALTDSGEKASEPPPSRLRDRALHHAEDAMSRPRLIADLVVGAFFSESSDKAREAELARRKDLVQRWLTLNDDGTEDIDAYEEILALSDQIRKERKPFHWFVEFPEVFFAKRPDPLDGWKVNEAASMDAFVGNPPFMGVTGISATHGLSLVQWLHNTVEGDRGNRGQCDLSAYFLRRCAELLGQHGAFGLISTNTIGQGDTARIGLRHLTALGHKIIDARTSFPWPGEAAVMISHVVLGLGRAADVVDHVYLDGVEVKRIDAALGTSTGHTPVKLAHGDASAFKGVMIQGQGFAVTPETFDALVTRSSRNAERLFPYVGGKEVNTSPMQHFDRYVIDFASLGLAEAGTYPELLRIVLENVKPERDRLHRRNSVNRDRARRWWQFAGRSPQLHDALAFLSRCLVTSEVSKHLCFSFQPTNRVFANTLYVFPLPRYAQFALLQSRIHEVWARLLSSTMEDRLRYAASDCFETFPFHIADPKWTPTPQASSEKRTPTYLAVDQTLETIGQKLYEARAEFMVRKGIGLTKYYNLLKAEENAGLSRLTPADAAWARLDARDQEIAAHLAMHEELDRIVLRAYDDIATADGKTNHEFSTLQVPPFNPHHPDYTATFQTFHDAVIDRLYALNTERAAEEAAAAEAELLKNGPAKKTAGKKTKTAPGLAKAAPNLDLDLDTTARDTGLEDSGSRPIAAERQKPPSIIPPAPKRTKRTG